VKWRALGLIAAAPFAALIVYAGLGFGLGAVATDDPPPSGPVPLAIIANPYHSELVMPASLWKDFLPLPPDARVVGIGWGDLAFYAATPTVEDIKVGPMLDALSGQGPATLHVTWWPEEISGEDVHPLPVTTEQAAVLIGYIRAGFADAPPVAIPDLAYGSNDAFFPATGHWTPYLTCNEWLARGLRLAGIRTGLWAPFAAGITHHLKNDDATR
jgi:uncharacterized protein (TIGR02117 family)